ncbi:MAG: HD domain-containing protein [Alphaproteobacteria bacterium]|nr:HD domain-containing protein [Alphaproteobacteria bacterium]
MAYAGHHPTVSFTQMKDGTADDYELLEAMEAAYAAGTADRILLHLKRLEHSNAGYQICRLDHSLQTATRAERDGADIDWIVTALLHDIGDELAPFNHDSIAAAVIKPYVREECSWVCQHHGIFQMVYYAHFQGGDPSIRDRYRDHPFYQAAVDFCERWDQASFDPDYDTLTLAHFAPMLHEVFSREPWDGGHLCLGQCVPLYKA